MDGQSRAVDGERVRTLRGRRYLTRGELATLAKVSKKRHLSKGCKSS